MSRIVAGVAGGRRLATPEGRETRPTSDRVREALFSSLEAELASFENLVVADLYAGSGALGLEALSRGARAATFVESGRRALSVLRRNVADLGLAGATVLAGPVERAVRGVPPAGLAHDVVFCDPPYAVRSDVLGTILADALEHDWLAADAVVVVERATRDGEPVWPDGVRPARSRRYGETTLWYGHRTEPG